MEERYFFLAGIYSPLPIGLLGATLTKDRGAITYIIRQLLLKGAEVVMQAIKRLFLERKII